jgi:hypothetical protein
MEEPMAIEQLNTTLYLQKRNSQWITELSAKLNAIKFKAIKDNRREKSR